MIIKIPLVFVRFISVTISTFSLLKKYLLLFLAITTVLFSNTSASQTLNLGVLSSFEAFTGAGDVVNGGDWTGDAGTNFGLMTGFNLPDFTDNTYNGDNVTSQAIEDLLRLYIGLNDLFVDFPGTHAAAFGVGETITPGVYSIPGAGSIGGALTLDGEGDPDAFFVIKFNGAMTVGAGAVVHLINGAKSSNVFYMASGAITLAASAKIKGTLFAKVGAVNLAAGAVLEGRMFTMSGAIGTAVGAIVSPPLTASTIQVLCETSCSPALAVDVLGTLSEFALYTNLGAVANTGISGINGNIGTAAGSISGYSTGVHIGDEHVSDANTIQAALDIDAAYVALMALPVTATHAAAFGAGEILLPGVYDMAAGSLGGTITLDGLGDTNAIFVMRFAGAFNVAALSKIILINGARRCNVFWIGGANVTTGAVNLGAGAHLKGNFISHGGACNSGVDVFLSGRQLSTSGAVNTAGGIIYMNPECITSASLDAVVCTTTAENTTTTTNINEEETKTLTGNPSGGSWSIVSGSGDINGATYTPININTNTSITIRYTIDADATCPASTDDVTFIVTPVCIPLENTTSTDTISANQTKTLTGNPSGGTWSILSGSGTINGFTFTADDVQIDTEVIIRYEIPSDGDCTPSSKGSSSTTADVTFTVIPAVNPYHPTAPANCFSIFVENNIAVTSGNVNGSIAAGGNLTINGNYGIGSQDCGCFDSNGNKIGLLVGGQINYTSGIVSISNTTQYAQIGASNGSNAWYADPLNAPTPIRVTPGTDYNAASYVQLLGNAVDFNASPGTNPVFAQDLIDFSLAFQRLRTNSISISENTHNASLEDNTGNPISNTNLPNDVEVFLNNSINYMNITAADLNAVQNFTTQNHPNSAKVLIINVNAPGTFNWNVWSQAGFADQDAPYVIYNFYNTTQLNIEGTSTIYGTLLAPFAAITKTVNTENILGQVIGTSFTQNGGDVKCANFIPEVVDPTISSDAPIAEFTVNNNECFDANEYVFNNTSNTGATTQPIDPISYSWDFGDGTSSIFMNLTKTYATSGTYAVTLTATNTFGSDTQTSQITVLPNLTINLNTTTLASTNTSVTKQFTVINPADFQSYNWYLLDANKVLISSLGVDVTTTTNNFTQAGLYYLQIIALDVNGCSKEHEFLITIASSEVTTGNAGGVESESLGDAISKIYVNRKKNSEPTIFVKSDKNIYNKTKLKKEQPFQGKGQTMLDMFPTELIAGNIANITSPTDILDYTVADEVLSVDFSMNGKTKGVVLGIKTSDKIYNHTKASCDRLRGAEILNIQTVQLEGYNFLMQGIKQRSGVIEYAISFAVAKNNNDAKYTIQTNWYVNAYTKFNDVYNFQVWSTNHEDTQKLVKNILENLNGFIPVAQTEIQKVPKTFAAKISRNKSDLIIKLKSTKKGVNTEISMEEIYSETANNVKYRYNPLNTELEQILKVDISDGYEYDGLIKVDGTIEDAFYHADGNWGLDYDKKYTEVKEYFISNNFDRTYNDEELAVNRNLKIKAVSEYDYLGIYKSLLPGNLSADYSEYGYLSFTAKGSGLIELGLLKSSVENWKEQYRVMVNLSEEEHTYYVPFDFFSSTGTTAKITPDDLTTITFTFLPVEANTKQLDLTISDVKFTKTAVEDQIVGKIEKFENNFMAYPNPSKGNVNVLLFSKVETKATVSLFDVTGKEIYSAPFQLTVGKNEIDFNVKVKPGILFLKVNSKQVNYGTSKIMFR